MNHPGPDLDQHVARSLYGEWREQIPEFSSRDQAADYLIRFLKRSRIQAVIDIDNGRWRCRLSNAEGPISVGTGDTRPIAVCGAVLNANFHSHSHADRETRPAPPARREWPRRTDRVSHRCAECGVALAVSKGPADRPRYCNLCSWERGREKLSAESRSHRR
jgi:hypothetical protein